MEQQVILCGSKSKVAISWLRRDAPGEVIPSSTLTAFMEVAEGEGFEPPIRFRV